MVFNGNMKGAMSLILEKGRGGILKINETVKKKLLAKHPKALNPQTPKVFFLVKCLLMFTQ